MRLSLQEIRAGRAGLNGHRRALLAKVPNSNDYASFEIDFISMKDLAYLTAATGDEFALLEGKHDMILFHGTALNCNFPLIIYEGFMSGKYQLYGHSHPGEDIPVAPMHDIRFLAEIGQAKSRLISARTGIEITFGSNQFDPII